MHERGYNRGCKEELLALPPFLTQPHRVTPGRNLHFHGVNWTLEHVVARCIAMCKAYQAEKIDRRERCSILTPHCGSLCGPQCGEIPESYSSPGLLSQTICKLYHLLASVVQTTTQPLIGRFLESKRPAMNLKFQTLRLLHCGFQLEVSDAVSRQVLLAVEN